MPGNQLLGFGRQSNIDTGCSIGFLNRLPPVAKSLLVVIDNLNYSSATKYFSSVLRSLQCQFVHLKLYRYGVVTSETSQTKNVLRQTHRFNQPIDT